MEIVIISGAPPRVRVSLELHVPLLRRLSNTKNSEARELRHDIDNNQTNKLEWWMILKISLRAKAGIPKTLVKQKFPLHSMYFPQTTLM